MVIFYFLSLQVLWLRCQVIVMQLYLLEVGALSLSFKGLAYIHQAWQVGCHLNIVNSTTFPGWKWGTKCCLLPWEWLLVQIHCWRCLKSESTTHSKPFILKLLNLVIINILIVVCSWNLPISISFLHKLPTFIIHHSFMSKFIDTIIVFVSLLSLTDLRYYLKLPYVHWVL